MADPLDWIDDESARWSARGLGRRLDALGGSTPGRVVVGGRSLVNFGSNDYLGLASDPRVIAAAAEAASRYGWGSGASPLVTGWREPHDLLASEIAEFEQAEAAVLFPSGYAANLGTIAALIGPGDAAYLDRLDHACLVDGAKLSGARLRVFPHNDEGRLAEILARDAGRFRRSLIVTEGAFSMDGDLAPVDRLADLADEFGAMLLVDEAHATGVIGPTGRGAAEACGAADRVHVRVGTLSKALGSQGGFVAGSARLVRWLVNHARPLIYSTSLPPAAAAAAREALRIGQLEAWRRGKLEELADSLRGLLVAAGLDVGGSSSPIVPVILGDASRVVAESARLRALGYLVPAIRPPTVPQGTSRLRISLTAAHTPDDVRGLADRLVRAANTGRGP